MPLMAATMAATWAGVEPQQPPMKRTPAATSSGTARLKSSGPAVYVWIRRQPSGQTGIAFDPQRQIGAALRQFPCHPDVGVDADPAVGADEACATFLRGLPCLGRRDAHHGAVLFLARVEGETDADRQVAGAQAGAQRRLGFLDIGHGLDHDGVGATFSQGHACSAKAASASATASCSLTPVFPSGRWSRRPCLVTSGLARDGCPARDNSAERPGAPCRSSTIRLRRRCSSG